MFYDSKMYKNVTRLCAFLAIASVRRRRAGGRAWVWCAALYAALCTAAMAALPVHAQHAGIGNGATINNNTNGNASALERRVKAAFLYKFLGYAEFPPGAFFDGSSPVVIGVVGADDLAGELARAVAGRTVNNRPVVVRVLRDTDVQVPLHLLFVGGADPLRVGRMVRQASAAMLVVTECEDGLRQGSVINFRIIDERVRFDVSLDAAERNGIKLSSRLLTVANRVQKGVQ
ncbi:YfiR family protein [Massilia phyllosphaerae]|uniref:YfiR family protein n=1 Tax=Massilia phyllosphaerae TaxID=3106034 RepID=UPI002B1CDDA9|nr:YfiR family protein [Massilia sp. SGZ-792]